ncbi:MAG: oxidoreductase, partial [Marinovum sp.]|nr:oxidoreductase [Marinovum sp.]
MFNAVLIEKDEDGTVTAGIKALSEEQLPDGDVTVA